MLPRDIDRDKRCFTYCGDERCDCDANPTLQAFSPMTDIKSLLPQMMEAAGKATPDEWRVEGDGPNPNLGYWTVEGRTNVADHCTKADAAHIALASPSNILALCNAYIALEGANERLARLGRAVEAERNHALERAEKAEGERDAVLELLEQHRWFPVADDDDGKPLPLIERVRGFIETFQCAVDDETKRADANYANAQDWWRAQQNAEAEIQTLRRTMLSEEHMSLPLAEFVETFERARLAVWNRLSTLRQPEGDGR